MFADVVLDTSYRGYMPPEMDTARLFRYLASAIVPKRAIECGAATGAAHLVVNVDSDQHADGSPARASDLNQQRLNSIVRTFDANVRISSDTDLEMFNGGTKISLLQWECDDPPSPGIPNQHTLERILCAALTAAYPHRALLVQSWLDSRPDAPGFGPKEHAWSYLAGWHADVGSYEGFCEAVWNNKELLPHLRSRLVSSGVWRVAESLAV